MAGKRALAAVAHTLVVLIYRTLSSGQRHQERGVMQISEQKRQRLIRHHVRRL